MCLFLAAGALCQEQIQSKVYWENAYSNNVSDYFKSDFFVDVNHTLMPITFMAFYIVNAIVDKVKRKYSTPQKAVEQV